MRLAGGALVATAIAPWLGGAVAHADDTLVSGDDRATAVAGNIHDQGDSTICDQLGFPNDIEVGGDNGDGVDANGIEFDNDGTYLDAVSVPAGKVIDVVVVKAGDFYNRYDAPVFANGLPVNDMHGPLVGQTENVPAISHWAACIGDGPQPTPPTGTVTGDCDNATVDVTAGSEDTTFVIDQDGTTQQDTVAAGESDQVVLPWSGGSTVSVGLPEAQTPLDSLTRDQAGCEEQPPPGTVTNPNVAFSNSCKGGISVVLSNMDANAPVTFHVTSADNGSSTSQDVKVRADAIRRLHVKVTEDTTGTVSVTAPGLSKQTHSFAKDCTQVLGEKTVRTPKTTKTPQVKGVQAQLPFTGLPAGLATAVGGLLLAAGGALTLAGRRRTARHAE